MAHTTHEYLNLYGSPQKFVTNPRHLSIFVNTLLYNGGTPTLLDKTIASSGVLSD